MTTTTFESDPYTDQNDTDEFDDLDQEDQSPEADEDASPQDASASGNSGKKHSKPRRSSKLTKRQVETILATRSAVDEASDEARDIASTLLGTDADINTLTTSITTADRSAARAVNSLVEIATIDEQIERVLVISAWDKPTTSTVWKLLAELSLTSGRLPDNEAKAAVPIAKAADDLPDAISEVAELIGG